jgi:hypothetical protein
VKFLIPEGRRDQIRKSQLKSRSTCSSCKLDVVSMQAAVGVLMSDWGLD